VKAVAVHGAGDLRVEERRPGELPPTAVRVHVVYGGTCDQPIPIRSRTTLSPATMTR
jgi:D-arabinose 1-dehydrogenase-like Zn-dependent alcohol dehydrogenase